MRGHSLGWAPFVLAGLALTASSVRAADDSQPVAGWLDEYIPASRVGDRERIDLSLPDLIGPASCDRGLPESEVSPPVVPAPVARSHYLALRDEGLPPSLIRGQDATGYALPDVIVPSPLGSSRPESGVFFYGSFAMYAQTMPLKAQRIASRGILDFTGEITGVPRFELGLQREALNVDQVTGPQTQQPGFKIGIGYRFSDGSALDLNWLHINTQRYTAVATPIPVDLELGTDVESFLFAPVGNFPLDFSGPFDDTSQGPAFGIWNGADLMTIDFTQRNEIYELIYRLPAIVDTLEWRTTGYIGPRFVWFWERFRWRTFDFTSTGQGNDVWNAYYTNIISNRMYGVKIGCQNDWYVGNGFAWNFDMWATPMINFVKKRAKYERGDRNFGPERKRSDTDYTLVPELGAAISLNWFPYEAIQVKASYNLMAYFNTVTSEHPVDFDYSGVNPGYERNFRHLRGLEIGVMIRF